MSKQAVKVSLKVVISIIISAIIFFTGASITIAGSNDIVIKGSTTVLPIIQRITEAYLKEQPQLRISISGGGSGNGIKALIDRSAQLATSSRFIKKKEIQLAQATGVFPVPHRLALDAIVPVVHPSNPVTGLSLAQLRDIFTGKIKNWQQLGGKKKSIVVISRDTSSGTYEVWQKVVLQGKRVTPRALLQASNGMIMQTISKNPYAIGYVGLGYLNSSLKPSLVGGVVASEATVSDGTYLIARPLFMFTDGWPQGKLAAFVKFILSPQGQRLVKEEGYLPLYPLP